MVHKLYMKSDVVEVKIWVLNQKRKNKQGNGNGFNWRSSTSSNGEWILKKIKCLSSGKNQVREQEKVNVVNELRQNIAWFFSAIIWHFYISKIRS